MAAIYSDADSEVYKRVNQILADHFSVVAGLQPALIIQIRMALDPKSGVNLKHHGHPCAAKIKIVKPDERSTWVRNGESPDFPDIRLFIDKDIYDELSETGKTAILWHELNHIVPVRDKKSGSIRHDEYGRVKLKLRLDDWMLTGFYQACELFGDDALELQALRNVRSGLIQLGLSFSDDVRSKRGRKPKSDDAAISAGEEAA